MKFLLLATAMFALSFTSQATAMEAKLLDCRELFAIDGDNVSCDGINMRDMGDGAPNVSGYDTPEIRGRAKCPKENELGEQATKRMGELLASQGVQVFDSGERDRLKRPLVWVKLANGTTIGSIMIKEGLARVWTPGYKANWC